MKNYIFTSESVTRGHPDKICDIISDLILDEALSQDPDSKMAVEITIKDNFLLIYGEQNTRAKINYEYIAKNAIKEIGYSEDYEIVIKVNKQSKEINKAVEHDNGEIEAGDQGIMFGYASNETKNHMPAPIYYAHLLAKKLDMIQKEEKLLGPDGKTQVSIEYENDKVKRIDSIIISTQHKSQISQKEIKELILKKVIIPNIEPYLIDKKTRILINPSGSFIVGGSFGDSGTTGRKIVCDTYGGMGHIGGGCLSSKDPSKVDRSGAYYARYVAKNIVANKLAKKCEIQIAYAIGQSNPISIYVETFGTSKLTDEELMNIINKNFNFNINNIIKELNLKRPIYYKTSCYGHFGKEYLPWEQIKTLSI